MSRLPRSFLRPVGDKVRECRARRGMTLDQLATATGLSKGLLSKIENFRAVPSLPVLATIARAFDLPLAELVAEVEVRPRRPYLLVRSGEGKPVRREAAEGFRYRALQAAECGGTQFQAFHLELDPACRRAASTTEGDEFIQVLRGQVDFLLGDEALLLATGDALYFDGRIPHVPRNRGRAPATLLVVYLIPP